MALLRTVDAVDAAHPSGEPEADAELQRPAAAALANLCSEVSLAEGLVQADGMQALAALSESQDRQVQVITFVQLCQCEHAALLNLVCIPVRINTLVLCHWLQLVALLRYGWVFVIEHTFQSLQRTPAILSRGIHMHLWVSAPPDI